MQLPSPDNLVPRSSADPAQWVTVGNWSTEQQAEDFFVSFVQDSGLFKVYRQVWGEPLWKRHFQRGQRLRIDVLLFPSRKLLAGGWPGGPGCRRL